MNLNELKIIGATESAKLVGLSRSGIAQQESIGNFPNRILITEKRYGYSENEVKKWLEDKYKLRDKFFPPSDSDKHESGSVEGVCHKGTGGAI